MLYFVASALAFNAPTSKVGDNKFMAAVAPAILPAVTAATLAVGGALPAYAADVGAGGAVFDGNCAACHAGGQNVIMPEKTLEKAALSEYLDGGFSAGSVVKQARARPRARRGPAADSLFPPSTPRPPHPPQSSPLCRSHTIHPPAPRARTQVTNGKNAMPAFGGRLSDEDIQNVAAYVVDTANSGWD